MKSSYTNTDINYGDILSSITFAQSPKTIVEIGILDGYSLSKFVDASSTSTMVHAYDIFDEFNGNAASKDELLDTFRDHPNVTIDYGDFYKLHTIIPGNIDIIHIDIANDGDVYDYAIKNYMNLLSPTGMLILEGGSKERDEVEWMTKYNKTSINPLLSQLNHVTLGSVPSMTLIR